MDREISRDTVSKAAREGFGPQLVPKKEARRIPEPRYLARLERRNDYLIEGHHPLKETLKKQTGSTEKRRRNFLIEVDRAAISYAARRWQPDEEYGDGFDHT